MKNGEAGSVPLLLGSTCKMILHSCVDFTVTVHDETNGEPLMNANKR